MKNERMNAGDIKQDIFLSKLSEMWVTPTQCG